MIIIRDVESCERLSKEKAVTYSLPDQDEEKRMSRAHMLYDDKPLESGATTTSKWPSSWNDDVICKGNGVIIEGLYKEKGKHVIVDSSGRKHRFIVIHVEVAKSCKRQYDGSRKEIEPNFGMQQKVNTGYLMSSYKTKAKGETDVLDFKDLVEIIACEGLTDAVKAKHSRTIVLWGYEQVIESMEFDYGQSVRAKTRGDCPLIETITQLSSTEKKTAGNYAGGDAAGTSWTDKVMAVKSTGSQEEAAGEGVDDDEWVD